MNEVQPLEKAQRLVQCLTDLDISYGDMNGFSMQVSPDVFLLTAEERLALEKRGSYFWEWLAALNQLYRDSLRNPQLDFVRQLLEAGLTEELVAFQRNCLNEYPWLMRADQPSLTSVCEIQVPMSMAGWGFVTGAAVAYQRVIKTNGRSQTFPSLAKKFYQGLSFASGKDRPVVFIPWSAKTDYRRIQQFITRHFQELGLKVMSRDITDLADPTILRDIDIIYVSSKHRCDPQAGRLLLKAIEHEVRIEPPMNLLADQKISMTFPFLQATRDYFSDNVRSLFTPTVLIQEGATITATDSRTMSVEEVFHSPISVRKGFIVKYAGIDPKLKSGGAAVFRLDGSSKKSAEFFSYLMAQNRQGSPWILQVNSADRRPITFLNRNTGALETKDMYYRFNPFYLRNPDGQISLVGAGICLRDNWKVHGHPDTVFQEVRFLTS